jgi:DNA-directed RNA polymerase
MTSSYQQQLALEQEGVSLGIKKYRENLLDRDLTDLPPGLRLMKMVMEPFSKRITEWLDEPGAGQANRWKPFFRQFDPNVIAFLTAKNIINHLASSVTRSYQSIALGVTDMLCSHLDYEAFKRESPGLVYTIEKDNRWASASHRRATLLRAKKKHMGDSTSIPAPTKLHIGHRCIEMFIESTGLVEKVLLRRVSGKENYILQATKITQEWLEKANSDCELLQPMFFPMIVTPRDWTSPVGGGFLTNHGTLQVPLVKTNHKELMALADQDLSKVYAAINAVQHTEWRINRRILDVMSEVWLVGDRAGLPAKEIQEIPRKTWEETANPTREQLITWKKAATTVYEQHARNSSKRIATEIKLHIAKRMMNEQKIYFVWNLDWRGRMYPIQSFVNPQADDSGRALLEFADGKSLGSDGAFWLAVHGANTFGYDKASFEERVEWVIENEPAILGTADDPMSMLAWWEQADSPFQFLAFCFEWAGYRQEGETYVSNLPVALDGSCNGLQNFSAMLRDAVGGKATNLVPSESPSDIYQQVANLLSEKVSVDSAAGERLALPWVGHIDRKITKRGVMTTPYGVTRYGLTKQLQFEVEKIDKNYLGVELAGPYYMYLSSHLYDAIGEVVVAARSAMVWLQKVAMVVAKTDKVVRWSTPIGFTPCQEYHRQKLIRVDTLFGGIRVRFGLWKDTIRIDKRRMSNGIAPNFVHSLDASHLMSTINLCRENGLQNFSCVHDSFGTLAADAGKLAYYLREAFITQYSGDVLQSFRDEVIAQLPPELVDEIPPLPEKGDLDLQKIRESRYFFA